MELSDLKDKLQKSVEHLRSELVSVRTSRASATLVEDLKIEAYEGSPPLTLKELATITTPEPNLIVVQPWDVSVLPKIEKALREERTLGLSPVSFDDLIRLPVPPLSQERREEMAKLIGEKAEAARVAVRSIRQDAMRSIDEMEKNKVLSEDERFRQRSQAEAEVKEVVEQIDSVAKAKESEVLSV